MTNVSLTIFFTAVYLALFKQGLASPPMLYAYDLDLKFSWKTDDLVNSPYARLFYNLSFNPDGNVSYYEVGDGPKLMVAWTPQVTGKPSLPLLVAMQNAVLATRAPGSETDTIRWKLVIRSWSSLVFDSYCPSPDPLFPDCPDVINLGSTQIAWAWKKNLLLPLGDYFASHFIKTGHSIRDDMVKYSVYDYFTSEGEAMGMVYNVDLRLLAINKTVFDQHGLPYPPPLGNSWGDPPTRWTWEKVVEFANIIAEPGKPGFEIHGNYDEEDKLLAAISRDPAYNAVLLKAGGTPASWSQPMADRCGWDSPAFRSLVNSVIRQMWVVDKSANMDFVPPDQLADHLRTEPGLGDPTTRPPLCCQNWGKADGTMHGITFTGLYDIVTHWDLFDPEKSDVVPVYAPSYSFLGGTGMSILRTTTDDTLAWGFLEQLLTPEVMELNGNVSGVPAPYESIFSQSQWSERPVYKIFVAQMRKSVPMQYPNVMFPEMNEFEQLHPGRHLLVDMVYKNATVDEAVDRACYAINYAFTPPCIAYGSPKTNKESCENWCDILNNATTLVSLNGLIDQRDTYKGAVATTMAFFLLVLLVMLATAIRLIRNHIKHVTTQPTTGNEEGDGEEAIKHHGIWQARPTIANYLAVAALFGDFIQFSAVQMLATPEWAATFTSGLSMVGLVFNWKWLYLACYFAVLPLWFLYTGLFSTGAAAKMMKGGKTWVRWGLAPAVYLLLFCGTFGFLPIVHSLIKVGSCRYGPENLAIMDLACTYSCWDARHYSLTVISFLVCLFFIPVQLTHAPVWQEIQSSLDIKATTHYLVTSLIIKVIYTLIFEYFFDAIWGFLLFIFVLNISLCIYTFRVPTMTIKWANQLTKALWIMTTSTSLAVILSHAIVVARQEKTQLAEDLGLWVLVLGWVGPLCWFLWDMKRNYPVGLFVQEAQADATEKLLSMMPARGNKKQARNGADKEVGMPVIEQSASL